MAMQLIYIGGQPDRKAIVELLKKAPASWTTGDSCPLYRWTWRCSSTGRPGYLRMLLIRAAVDAANHTLQAGRAYSLGTFMHMCGWTENEDTKDQLDKLTECEEWFEKNESRLKYDSKKRRFVGAVAPKKAALATVLQAVPAKYNVSIDDALEPTYAGPRSVRLALAQLVLNNKDAAAAHAVHDAIMALLDPAQFDGQDIQKLLVAMPKSSHELAARIYARLIEWDLLQWLKDEGSLYSLRWYTQLDQIDPKLATEARASLFTQFKNYYAAADANDAEQRARRAMAYVFIGGPMDAGELDKIIGAALLIQPHQLTDWGVTIAKLPNTAGLHILLSAPTNAKGNTQALGAFEQFSGLAQMQEKGMHIPNDVTECLTFCRAWLQANEKSLIWNVQQQHFTLPEVVEPPKPPKPPNDF